ncbi:hypothetical protein GCM10023347_27170 [Streptomyces chumphonensis]|uniref:Uncharacterized protein n=1 Tax=Streptomyces chumphonensis TaxID=1214925 RepID=A0A927F022_9ACTN|nr:hypothetical protein [Streptomyces chumphonensis]MBD3932525.1 hypothetical protein [Streptomyces chumphonensis]
MRTFVAGQEAYNASEFTELALGIDRELFVGVPGESHEERAARMDVAREALADLRERAESDEVAAWDALYAEALTRTVPMLRAAARRRRVRREGEAA